MAFACAFFVVVQLGTLSLKVCGNLPMQGLLLVVVHLVFTDILA
jgi:hypothetical protein